MITAELLSALKKDKWGETILKMTQKNARDALSAPDAHGIIAQMCIRLVLQFGDKAARGKKTFYLNRTGWKPPRCAQASATHAAKFNRRTARAPGHDPAKMMQCLRVD